MVEADAALTETLADDVIEADERSAADEQDVGRVHLDVLLLGVLAASLRRHIGHGSLEHLEKRLLHAFARDVAGNRDVLRGLADLVDLVDVDDAALRVLQVVVGRLQQLEQQVLDVLADVAGLGEGGGVADRKRHVQNARERLRKERLACAGRADQHDVRLVELDRILLALDDGETLVVVVDGDGERALGGVLADHVLVEELLQLARRRNRREERASGRDAALLLLEDVLAEIGAVRADVDVARALDHGADLAAGLSAEAARGHLLAAEAAAVATTAAASTASPGTTSPGTTSPGTTSTVLAALTAAGAAVRAPAGRCR